MATKSAPRMVPITTVRDGVTHVMPRPASPLEFYKIRAQGMRRELEAAQQRGMAHLREGTRLELEAMECATEAVEALVALLTMVHAESGNDPSEYPEVLRARQALVRAHGPDSDFGDLPNGL